MEGSPSTPAADLFSQPPREALLLGSPREARSPAQGHSQPVSPAPGSGSVPLWVPMFLDPRLNIYLRAFFSLF